MVQDARRLHVERERKRERDEEKRDLGRREMPQHEKDAHADGSDAEHQAQRRSPYVLRIAFLAADLVGDRVAHAVGRRHGERQHDQSERNDAFAGRPVGMCRRDPGQDRRPLPKGKRRERVQNFAQQLRRFRLNDRNGVRLHLRRGHAAE